MKPNSNALSKAAHERIAQYTSTENNSLVDDQSWEEFLPKGETKEKFDDFKQYYDQYIFAAAGRRIRDLARRADAMDVEARIDQITTIFTSFRNPDKETVLTPWRVVNMQLGDTLGGYVFYDKQMTDRLPQPRSVDNGAVTHDVYATNTHVLEINYKSGLYPLYVAYSIYRTRIESEKMQWMITETVEDERLKYHLKVWDETLRNNIFVICKTPMAKSITCRTLAGFRNAKMNVRYFDDLVNQITNKKEQFIKHISNGRDY